MNIAGTKVCPGLQLTALSVTARMVSRKMSSVSQCHNVVYRVFSYRCLGWASAVKAPWHSQQSCILVCMWLGKPQFYCFNPLAYEKTYKFMLCFKYCAIYSTDKKPLKKPPTNQTVSCLERQFLLLSCKLLDCTAELLVSSKWVYCFWCSVSHCKPP